MLDSTRLVFAFFSHKGFKLFQMDVKCVLLNCFIEEEVSVKQPLDFENLKFPYHVINL